MKVDTTAIEQEIAAYEKQLRQHYSTKSRLMEEIDSLDPDDRLYKMYDKIEEVENGLMIPGQRSGPLKPTKSQATTSIRF